MAEKVTPLTEDQLNMMSEQTNHALHKYSRRAAAGFLVLIAANIFVYWTSQQDAKDSREAIVSSGQAVAVDGCNRDFKSTLVLRGLLTAAERSQKDEFRRGHITPAQYALGKVYFERQLAKIILPDCGEARNILTDDPNANVTVPKPLSP